MFLLRNDMSNFTFNSSIKHRGSFKSDFSSDVIKNEPMFFNCDLEFAYSNGGQLTKSFIDALPDDWLDNNPVLDSRVHMLMNGWFPCIPGYHHDDIARNIISGQPDYDNMAYQSEHLMGLVNGDICPTVFALGIHQLPKIDNDIIYKTWHPIVENQIETGVLKTYEVPSGKLIQFDWQSMHTGQRANANGWRWFIRLSRNTDRQLSITNEIRRQVQVYLEFPMEGW